ncbi:MAG: THxN family PEP-CTERM protein [Rhodospirillales bacterium]
MKPACTLRAAGLAVALAVGSAGAGHAEPFQLTSSGVWTAVEPSGLTSLSGLGTNEITFGDPAGSQPSAYRFEGTTVGPLTQAELLGGTFPIGDFIHENFPIFPPSITSATLQVSLNIDDLGNGETTQDFTFQFMHNETPNFPGGDTCPDTGVPTADVPAGCPDVVSLDNMFSQQSVVIDGVERFLQIVGFIDENGMLVDEFVTRENQENVATLLVQFAEPVSEPAPLAFLGAGLVLLGWQHARRRKG